jgi:alginate O-acetyltransferase complex protein AlgJ
VRKKNLRLQYTIIPILFISYLLFPYVNSKVGFIDNDMSKNRNLKFAEKPAFNISYLDPFPADYELFYNDYFPLRKIYTNINSYINFFYYKKSTSKYTIIGEDDWMFLNNRMLPNRNKNYLEENVAKLVKEYKYRTKYYNNRGIKYYVFIVPSKASVYPEFLPNYLDKTDTLNSTHQLMQQFNKEGINNIYYLLDLLKSHKNEGLLYFKNDHHWNDIGAFHASDYILKIIQKDFPQVGINHNLNNFEKTYEETWKGSLSKNLGLKDIISETAPVLKPKEKIRKIYKAEKRNYKIPEEFPYKGLYELHKTTKNKSLPNILIIRDSFGNYLYKFLSPHFNRSIYIWDNWKYKINKHIVEKEKPDIVINIMVESRMNSLFGNLHSNKKK